MKKIMAVGLAFIFMFFSLIGASMVSAAADVSPDMKKAVEKNLSQEHYDYDKGSLALEHVKTVNLDQPIGENISTVKMAVAEYNTVRDSIFYSSHKQIVYYAPGENGKVLKLADVSDLGPAQQYKEQYKDITGTKMHLSVILPLCVLILLVPGFFAFIWAKQQYSVLKYKLKNNLLHNTGPHTFN